MGSQMNITGELQDTGTHEMDSSKSYTLSVCLVGVFGTLGFHHFYLGRWLHGVFDLSLVIMTVSFLFIFWPLAVVTLVLDIIHTVYFMYKLIVGEYRDGAGGFVSIPS